ncbi:MAG: GspE/PulE family protein, partial [Spirochaetaceae bacterium]
GARGPSGGAVPRGAVPGGNIGGGDVPGGGAAIDVLTRSTPAVSFVDALLHDAVGAGASDVHVETGAQRSVVRYRIDGVLHTVRSYRAGDFAMVVSRLKVLSRVDATERRLPQDGRFSFKVAGIAYDVRTSFLPCDGGESVAVRLLETADRSRDLGSLGLGAPEEGQLAGLDTAAGGLVVVSGPTGSGKTTTVHALLARYRDGRRKILTVEDPVEYRLSGVTQITVRRDIGLDFDAILRRVLRHDPDVLAVGEIRDGETAALAVRAALSGHPVFSTVHTPDTTSVQARFENLGVPPHLLREVTAAQISQRLVRRVCPVCGRWREASEGERRAAGAYGVVLGHVREGTGCPACRHAGYRGRVGVFRVHTAGFEGDPLPAAGWRLVLGGDTTPHELARSLGAAAWRMRSGGAR